MTPPKKMSDPSVSNVHDASVVEDGHADDDTSFVSIGSENCMTISTSPTRFVDVSDSCILCMCPVENEAQVRLKCGHQYHLNCWMRRMRYSPECVKCNPKCCDSNPSSPARRSTTIDDMLLKEFALRAYTLLQNNEVYRHEAEAGGM